MHDTKCPFCESESVVSIQAYTVFVLMVCNACDKMFVKAKKEREDAPKNYWDFDRS